MEDDGDFEYFGYWLPSGQNFEKFFILRGEKIYIYSLAGRKCFIYGHGKITILAKKTIIFYKFILWPSNYFLYRNAARSRVLMRCWLAGKINANQSILKYLNADLGKLDPLPIWQQIV